ncbi:formate dehydrogenase accessory sulfurtransferase FdhD [uncultured Cetobacterium sp.]|uniref:formate dehydrogenase accessory sulfurtransferase FdhD n=1 Tax=uncultured Cetobacterium sp. TaxID=527638 RepID=UPI0026095F87|nr:formate dehydrogenase accessory sulfurtransferase FdhD [uncultured Cetobacterium sp.]
MLKKSNVCEEAPVELKVNREKMVTFMCSPYDLEDLALGHLYTRGIIKSKDELESIAACKDAKLIATYTLGEVKDDLFTIPKVVLSGCGSGALFDEKVMQKEKIEYPRQISLERIKKVAREMLEGAIMYKNSGGMHCASIGNISGEVVIREDIGRHNAVDKVIGAALNKDFDLKNSVITTTGRLSLDMVLKAVATKIPVVATISIPSSLAIELAEKLGVCLIGRIGKNDPIIYTFENRIK